MIRDFFRNRILQAIAIPCLTLAMVGQSNAGFIDSINPNAAIVPNTDYGTVFNGVGWYYTPTTSYSLTGIYSQFADIGPFGTGSRTMTVQIQTERPVLGGTLLGQGSFVGDSAIGGTLGSNFSPVTLTAGTTYFVDFLNIGGMSLNLGQWTTVNGVHVATAGATARLGGFYESFGTDSTFPTGRFGNDADEALATGNASGLEPILFFSGSPLATVPEPTSLLMVGIGLVGVTWRLGRGRSK